MAEENREKKGGSFIKQAAILASAGILVRIIGFLYRLPLTNMIGDTGNAIYSASYYIYTFLLILSSAGLPAAISKMVSERLAVGEYQNAHKVFKVSLAVSAALGLIFMIILIAFARPLSYAVKIPESYWCIISLSPTLFIVAVMSVYRGYFQGMHNMTFTSVSQIAEQIFNAFFSVYLAYLLLKNSGGDISLGAAGGTAGTGVGALAGLAVMFLAYKKARPAIKNNPKQSVKTESFAQIGSTLFKTAFPIIVGTAVFSITNLIDMVMVMDRLGVAGYTEAQAQTLYGRLSGKYVTLTTLPVAITTAMATATIPSIAASAKLNRKNEVRQKMNLVIRLAMIISIPAAVGIGALGDPIIRMLFPKASEGGVLLTVGAVAIIFLAFCQIVTGVLQGVGKVSAPVCGAVLGAITKCALNYALIAVPQINIFGAVISTTGCYVVASAFNMFVLSRITKVKFDFVSAVFKPCVASAFMAAGAILSYKLLFNVALSNTFATIGAIAAGVVVYAVVLTVIRGVSEEDLNALPMGGRLIPILRRLNML